HAESPGKLVEEDGQQFKEYFGSASEFQKGTHQNVEGKRILVPYKGAISDTLTEMRQDLQSSISYAGGKRLSSFKKVDYVLVRHSIFNGDML
ncbi:IMP dehydrogenase, partial [Clostridioides difficile]|uniref:IMP dehydrogenase n=1 Tax=Clostridioides difficile TaxID=1496 RepID=UPI002358EA6F